MTMDYLELNKLLAIYFFRADQLHKSEKLNNNLILELRAKVQSLKAKVAKSQLDPFLKKEISTLNLSPYPEAPTGFFAQLLNKKAVIPDYRKEIKVLRDDLQKITIFIYFKGFKD